MKHNGRSPWKPGLSLVCCFALLASCQVASPPEAIAPSPILLFPDRLSQLESDLARQINQYRQERNLPPLLLSNYLSQQARLQSERIASGSISYDGSQEFRLDFEERKAAIADVIPLQSLGVSLVRIPEQPDLEARIVKYWMENPKNRQQIAGNFDLTGIGIVRGSQGMYYVTQILLERLAPSPVPKANVRRRQPSGAPAKEATRPLSTLEREIFRAVNQYRQSRKLRPLKLNDRISAIARQHAQAMAKKEATFSHDGFDRRVARLKSTLPLRGVGENLAFLKGYPNLAETAVRGWIDSPGHRKTMEGNYNLTGIGIAKNSAGEYYFSQLFVLEP